MRLVSFGDDTRVGVLEGELVADLATVGLASTMVELIAGGEVALAAVADAMAQGTGAGPVVGCASARPDTATEAERLRRGAELPGARQGVQRLGFSMPRAMSTSPII